MPDKRYRPGMHFMMGNVALAEGAVAAGCRFMSGYPITPASEIANRLSRLLPSVDGTFLQTEDEIAAVCAAIGASWAGTKAMTATSGPGLSLMQENIGFAAATETPLVIVDVQRLGPSTGAPSVGVAGDMVQAARGSHGDYQIIALSPSSGQEMFDLTVRAFNLAERFRVPVIVLADAFLGHMKEPVRIPAAGEIETENRRLAEPGTDPLCRIDFLDSNVAPMPVFGRGCRAHVTSSCHDAHGMRNLADPAAMHAYVTKPIEKIISHCGQIVQVEADYKKGDVVLVSYGTTARAAHAAVDMARGKGLPAGRLRLKTIWPFPEAEVQSAARAASTMVVLENNLGQLFPYIKSAAGGSCPTSFQPPELVGQLHDPASVLKVIEEAAP
jgi:2-oxoglutarate/2-oxoacid ferredoxin oxidoreductase subunit alpha